jgi:hypothetical protein
LKPAAWKTCALNPYRFCKSTSQWEEKSTDKTPRIENQPHNSVNAYLHLTEECICFWEQMKSSNETLISMTSSDRVLGVLESSQRGGVHGLCFHGIWTCSAKVLEYWVISLKFKFNHSWKFWRNWNVPLVLLERSWWAGFNWIYLVRFGFRMWEILILSDFCHWKFK